MQAAPPPAIRINALLIEFALDTSSRFLFPAYSILEYGPGFKSCTASFLVKRKVSDTEDLAHYRDCAAALHTIAGADRDSNPPISQTAVDDITFWQPVTVRFACENGNVLEILARVVKPPNEVRAWMERVLAGDEQADEPPSKPPSAGPAGAATATGPLQPTTTATNGIKQEGGEKKNNEVDAKQEPKYPPGSLRADSRKLAMRLPKEDKGKENEA